MEKSAIRCKLNGIIPPHGLKEWSCEATSVLERLKDLDGPLTACIFTCEEFGRETGRFEIIYGIDLLFDGNESVTGYLVDELLAYKVSLNFYFLLQIENKK